MKTFKFLSLLILSIVSISCAQTKLDTKSGQYQKKTSVSALEYEREKFDPKRNPKDDLQTAIIQAKKENKRIILDIGGEWCSWCIHMDKFLNINTELKNLRDSNFLWVKVNFSLENENEAFLAQYPEIPGYPHLFVLETDGKFLHSQDTSELQQSFASLANPAPKTKEEAEEIAKRITYDVENFRQFFNKWSLEKSNNSLK